jgi:hypothetical protein
MKLMGGIRWVASMESTFLSYPQLARLDDNRFLLGYGKMYDIRSQKTWPDEKWRIPQAYYLVEIDSAGNALTDVQKLDSLGWGEQDQMVSLGKGRAAWAYIPKPALISSTSTPPCTSKALCLMVYTSKSQAVGPPGRKNTGFPGNRVRMDLEKNGLVITVFPGNDVQLTVTRIFDARGRMVRSTSWNAGKNQPRTRTPNFGKKLSAGTYIIVSGFSDGSSEEDCLVAP